LKASVLIPVFNEADTILPLLNKVKSAVTSIDTEILIGDDGSTDGTRDLLLELPEEPSMKVLFLERNVGRGGVIKHLWTKMTGDFVIHQDADLEYDPSDYQSLLDPLIHDRSDVVFGSRFQGDIQNMRSLNMAGNRIMTGMCRFIYGLNITDLMTCYKAYRASLVDDLQIQSNGFDFEAEFTARLALRKARFSEVPIRFVGRTFEEGKKIRAFDAFSVVHKLVRTRFGRR